MSEWSFEDLSSREDPDPDPNWDDEDIQTTLLKKTNAGSF